MLIPFLLAGCMLSLPRQETTSWKEQLEIAERAVTSIDPDAALSYISKDVISSEVNLDFVRPSGALIGVSFDATRIEQTLTVDTEAGYDSISYSQEDLQALRQAADAIQLSPSEVAKVAAKDQARTCSSAHIYIGHDSWAVLCQSLDESGFEGKLQVLVDAQTGVVQKVTPFDEIGKP